MKILLLIKQVPKQDSVKFDEKGNLIRENIELTINRADEYAIENALILKERFNFKTIAVTMGPESSVDVIRYAISKGIDEGYIITDPSLKGSDAYITSKVLHDSIKNFIDDKTIIFTGNKSEDGETGLVPSMIAGCLKIPSVSDVEIINFENSQLKVRRKIDNEVQEVLLKIPSIVSFKISSLLKLRPPSIKYLLKSKSYNVKNIFNTNLSGDKSPTYINEIIKKEVKISKNTQFIDVNDKDKMLEIKKMIYE